jgi:hypothetical protein
MDLFYADRVSTQLIAERSEQSVRVLPYEENAEYHQWVFEICRIEPTARRTMPAFALLDAFLASMKLGDVPETSEPHLREVDQEEARKILRYILSQDLAYGSSTTLPMPRVAALVEQLFQIFSVQPRYFTNGCFTSHPFRLLSWEPLTVHTFDTGLLLFDEQRIGILWAIDED